MEKIILSKDCFPGIPKTPNLFRAQPWKAHSYLYGAFPPAFKPLGGLANGLLSVAPFPRIQVRVSNDLYVFSLGGSIPCHRATSSTVSKILLEMIFPTWESPQSSIVFGELISQDKLYNLFVRSSRYCNIFIVLICAYPLVL